MIRAYTTSAQHSEALQRVAHTKGYSLELQVAFDADALRIDLEDLSVIVIDLACQSFNSEQIVQQLDSMDSNVLPPVLYLLADPAEVKHIANTENIVNQDYLFEPITYENLALRLEVLTMLGARRRMALESAINDKLTGLFNRKYFLRRLEEEMYRAQRYGYGVGVILVDVDFSADGELSEEAGTVAIKRVAEFFQDRLRRTDMVARFRWSEFAVLLPDIPADDCLAVAGDIKHKIEALGIDGKDGALTLRAAVGQVCCPAEGLGTAMQVVEALEDCCFTSKQEGQEVVTYAVTPAQ